MTYPTYPVEFLKDQSKLFKTEEQKEVFLAMFARGLNIQQAAHFCLVELLAAKKWKMANHQTQEIMWQSAGVESGFTSASSIKQVPCTVLLTIDELWREYSDEHFGFLIQYSMATPNCQWMFGMRFAS